MVGVVGVQPTVSQSDRLLRREPALRPQRRACRKLENKTPWHYLFNLWPLHGRHALARMKFMVTKPPAPPRAPTTPAPAKDDGGSVVLERRPQKTKPPQMYRVLMLNDDFTPMEFVIVVLQEFFSKDRETATRIMLKIHLDGKGVCGVYSRDVAATKVDQVLDAANKSGHPLQCVSEPVE